jgi:hypothetical protein
MQVGALSGGNDYLSGKDALHAVDVRSEGEIESRCAVELLRSLPQFSHVTSIQQLIDEEILLDVMHWAFPRDFDLNPARANQTAAKARKISVLLKQLIVFSRRRLNIDITELCGRVDVDTLCRLNDRSEGTKLAEICICCLTHAGQGDAAVLRVLELDSSVQSLFAQKLAAFSRLDVPQTLHDDQRSLADRVFIKDDQAHGDGHVDMVGTLLENASELLESESVGASILDHIELQQQISELQTLSQRHRQRALELTRLLKSKETNQDYLEEQLDAMNRKERNARLALQKLKTRLQEMEARSLDQQSELQQQRSELELYREELARLRQQHLSEKLQSCHAHHGGSESGLEHGRSHMSGFCDQHPMTAMRMWDTPGCSSVAKSTIDGEERSGSSGFCAECDKLADETGRCSQTGSASLLASRADDVVAAPLDDTFSVVSGFTEAPHTDLTDIMHPAHRAEPSVSSNERCAVAPLKSEALTTPTDDENIPRAVPSNSSCEGLESIGLFSFDADPIMCFATGEGLEWTKVGVSSSVTVHVRNTHGEPVLIDSLEGSIATIFNEVGEMWTVPLVPQDEGTYSVSFVVSRSCKHLLAIQVHRCHIFGSPFQVSSWTGHWY